MVIDNWRLVPQSNADSHKKFRRLSENRKKTVTLKSFVLSFLNLRYSNVNFAILQSEIS